jgi:hypothetical protein
VNLRTAEDGSGDGNSPTDRAEGIPAIVTELTERVVHQNEAVSPGIGLRDTFHMETIDAMPADVPASYIPPSLDDGHLESQQATSPFGMSSWMDFGLLEDFQSADFDGGEPDGNQQIASATPRAGLLHPPVHTSPSPDFNATWTALARQSLALIDSMLVTEQE